MSNKRVANVGTSPAFILFVLFLALKLCGVINWSWWWVTAPLWAPLIIAIIIFAFVIIAKIRK